MAAEVYFFILFFLSISPISVGKTTHACLGKKLLHKDRKEGQERIAVLPVPVQHQSFQFVKYISFQVVQHKFIFDHLAPIYIFFLNLLNETFSRFH